jgi:hypothetical protein
VGFVSDFFVARLSRGSEFFDLLNFHFINLIYLWEIWLCFFFLKKVLAFFYLPAAVFMCVAHLTFAFYRREMLYPASFLTGTAYGMAFATSTTLMSSLFGKKYAGTNV